MKNRQYSPVWLSKRIRRSNYYCGAEGNIHWRCQNCEFNTPDTKLVREHRQQTKHTVLKNTFYCQKNKDHQGEHEFAALPDRGLPMTTFDKKSQTLEIRYAR